MNDNEPIYVLDRELALYQSQHGFKTSMDSVMLGSACPAKSGHNILDLGCGVGSAGLCVLKRIDGAKLTGIDIQEDHIELAQKNARINEMSERANFITSNIKELNLGNIFNHIICNPPYMESGSHIESPSKSKAMAMGHIDEDITLQDWVSCAHRHIKGQGSLTMIHDAGQTDNIINALYSKNGSKKFGGIEIIPLYPKQNIPAKRVIIRAYKHKKSPCTIHQGIIMHEANGDYTNEANGILRDARKLI